MVRRSYGVGRPLPCPSAAVHHMAALLGSWESEGASWLAQTRPNRSDSHVILLVVGQHRLRLLCVGLDTSENCGIP